MTQVQQVPQLPTTSPHPAHAGLAIRPPRRRFAWAGLLLASIVAGCASSVAAPGAYAQPDVVVADPPARVGSISALRGAVDASVEAGDAWEPAKLNLPVTTGTALFTQPGSQAEVRIGSASVRLDGNTQAVFQKLDDDEVAIDVAQGTVRARVRHFDANDRFVLAADALRAEAQGPGDYRVSYDPERRAYTVRALAGRMRVVAAGNSFNLAAGQEALVEAGGANLALRPLSARDEFDAWAEARDSEQDRLSAARYVSPEMTGIESLDAHGRWEVVAEYGPVWYPRTVPYGWAPYRYGHWAYVRPWGWTWIDDAPWGFAPFHYGRWAMVGSGWCWVPGPIAPRPVYAPALVGYVGGGRGNVSFSVGFGSGGPVGWFPLGPGEYYHPPYRYSPRYVQHVNVINVYAGGRYASPPPAGQTPAYRYANQPNALTAAREDQFRGSRPIGADRINLTPQQVAGLQPVLVAPGGRPSGGGAPGMRLPDPRPEPRGDARPGPRGDRAWPGPASNGGFPQGDRGDRGDRGLRGGPPPNAAVPTPGAPAFERGPSTGRDLIPGAPGRPSREPVVVLPSAPAAPAQPAQQPRHDPRSGSSFGGRGDPRGADEVPGSFGGRGMPRQVQPAAELPRAAAPVPSPAQAAPPRGMPAPPVQAQPQPQPQPQPQAQPPMQHRGGPRDDGDGNGKGLRNGGPLKER